MSNRSKAYVVPECRNAMRTLKYEIAAELGLIGPNMMNQEMPFECDVEHSDELSVVQPLHQPQWRYMSSREVGQIGGAMTSRFVQMAQQSLLD